MESQKVSMQSRERETGPGRQVFSETQRMRQIQEEKRGDEQTKKKQ